jgi:hypothetical protein
MNCHKLIVVEGIPGSGKTTMAMNVQRWLHGNGIPNRLHCEGDLEGFIAAQELRQAIELSLLHDAGISNLVVDTSDRDWDGSQRRVGAFLRAAMIESNPLQPFQ